MSGFMRRLDIRALGLQMLVLLLTLLLCFSFSLSSCSPSQVISVTETEPLSSLWYSENTSMVQQDAAELQAGPRFVMPMPPDTDSLNFEEPVKNISRTPYRLPVILDKPSCVLAANIGGHAPPAAPAFAGGSMGQAI